MNTNRFKDDQEKYDDYSTGCSKRTSYKGSGSKCYMCLPEPMFLENKPHKENRPMPAPVPENFKSTEMPLVQQTLWVVQ